MHGLTIALTAALMGCGGGDAGSADGAVKEWGEAVNARDWERACELSAAPPANCETSLREDFAKAKLTFDGPASHGHDPKPGEQQFSFGGKRETVFVTAVPEDGEFRVRVEAIVVR